MPDIFINYRTKDVEYAATAIERDLSHRFGPERVFYASRTIEGGQNFPTALLRGARTCAVLLAVIGPNWLAKDSLGVSPLYDHEDWVRREIVEAFGAGAHVIPVLVGRRTERLPREELPKELEVLAECQTEYFDHRNADRDLDHLSKQIAKLVPALVDLSRSAQHGLPAEPVPAPAANTAYTFQNSSTTGVVQQGQGNTYRQEGAIGAMSGGSIGTVINNSRGPVHSGSGNQYTTATAAEWPHESGNDEA